MERARACVCVCVCVRKREREKWERVSTNANIEARTVNSVVVFCVVIFILQEEICVVKGINEARRVSHKTAVSGFCRYLLAPGFCLLREARHEMNEKISVSSSRFVVVFLAIFH